MLSQKAALYIYCLLHNQVCQTDEISEEHSPDCNEAFNECMVSEIQCRTLHVRESELQNCAAYSGKKENVQGETFYLFDRYLLEQLAGVEYSPSTPYPVVLSETLSQPITAARRDIGGGLWNDGTWSNL